MKTALVLLSLAANAVLGFLIYGLLSPGSEALDRLDRPTAAASGSSASTINVGPGAWKNFRAGTDSELVARLRAQGFPGPIIAVIVGYEIDQQLAQRREAIMATRKPIEYWKYSFWERNGLDEKGESSLRALEREKDKRLRALLGPDAPTDLSPTARKQFAGNLSEEKAEEALTTQNEYSEDARRLQAATGGVLFPEDREKLKDLEQALQTELAETLTPAELKEFKLHGSEQAWTLRRQLIAFIATDEEFAKIFSVQEAFDARYGVHDLTADEKLKRKQAEGELTSELQRVLGPDRFADYQKKTDGVYRSTFQFVAGAQLSPQVTDDLFALRQQVSAQSTATQADPGLTPAQRDERLTVLARDAQAKIVGLLGPTVTENYLKELGGWIKAVRPAAAGEAKPGPTK